MNRRFYCAVGVASGVLLLGGGVAKAAGTADEADRNIDLRATRGLPTDIFAPTVQQVTSDAGAGRTELLPGLGGGGGGPNAVLGLLGGLPGGNLLGQLTGKGSPLGQLLGSGPLANLLDDPSKKAAANDAGPAGAATGNSQGNQGSAFKGDDLATVWGQAPPVGNRSNGATAADLADPALGSAVANPTWRVPTLNQPTTPKADDASRGMAAQEEPAGGSDHIGDGFEESQTASGKPLAGGMLSPLSKIGRVQILGGGETMGNLPVVGNLLKDGLSLDTLNNIRGVSDAATKLGTEDAGKTLPLLGNLPSVGNVGRMLLGEESASVAKESAVADPSPARVTEHRAIDKAKVTPELVALFDSDALGVQADSGIIQQLPLAG